ncbi:MAG TPA: hypothetical protein GXZ37_02515 [Clostridiales bacterium]|nr:hypothetical protein [Clostridiales bacterium]
MIQKKSNPRWERKEPWKFIPRRDLFPDAEIPTYLEQTKPQIQGKEPEKKHNNPVQRAGNHASAPTPLHREKVKKGVRRTPLPENRALIPVKTKGRSTSIQPGFLILLFAGFLILSSRQKALEILDQPQSVQMLKSIGPYLNEKEQNIVYTAAGLMEAMQLIRDVANQNYHNQNQATLLNIPSNPVERKIGAMKAIKPYIHPEKRRQLDRVLNLYESAGKVQRNLVLYKNNRTLAGGKKVSPIESASDFLNVVRPVLSQEQREKADKAMQVMKMVEAMGTADKLSRNEKKVQKKGSIDQKDKRDQANQLSQKDQTKAIMDSFASLLNDEQKESMNMIMKMSQLLSQANQEDETEPGDM